MPSPEARIKRLEKKAEKVQNSLTSLKEKLKANASKASVAKAVADLDDVEADVKKIIKWIKLEQKWSEEVTKMLRLIDWDALAIAYPGAAGTNPPQTPPSWPPPE